MSGVDPAEYVMKLSHYLAGYDIWCIPNEQGNLGKVIMRLDSQFKMLSYYSYSTI